MNENFDPNKRNLEIIQTLMDRLGVVDCEEITSKVNDLLSELAIAIEIYKFHPRAAKLMNKRKNFIVIADDEPYFIKAYNLIRLEESRKGTWTEEDERLYKAAFDKRVAEVLKTE